MALLATVLPLNLREAIAGGLRRTVVAPLVSLQEQAVRGRSAFLSRDATTSRLDSVALRNMQLATLETANERLRALALSRRLPWSRPKVSSGWFARSTPTAASRFSGPIPISPPARCPRTGAR